jgi:hypothetical protein
VLTGSLTVTELVLSAMVDGPLALLAITSTVKAPNGPVGFGVNVVDVDAVTIGEPTLLPAICGW